MRKLTHKTHKIVPCKWNNWHNVSIKEYLTMALTPDLSGIFVLLIFAKSIFYFCVPTCYLSLCSVCWQWDTSGAHICDTGPDGSRLRYVSPFTRYTLLSGQLGAQHTIITMLLFIPPRPPTASWRLSLKYLCHHYPAPSPSGHSGFFLIFCIWYEAETYRIS